MKTNEEILNERINKACEIINSMESILDNIGLITEELNNKIQAFYAKIKYADEIDDEMKISEIEASKPTIYAIKSGDFNDPNNWQRPRDISMTFDLCTGYQKSNCCTGFISEEEPYCHTCKEHVQNECVECPYDKCPKRKEIK